jgi:hypothetical protein
MALLAPWGVQPGWLTVSSTCATDLALSYEARLTLLTTTKWHAVAPVLSCACGPTGTLPS